MLPLQFLGKFLSDIAGVVTTVVEPSLMKQLSLVQLIALERIKTCMAIGSKLEVQVEEGMTVPDRYDDKIQGDQMELMKNAQKAS